MGDGERPKPDRRTLLATALWTAFVLAASVNMISMIGPLKQIAPYPWYAIGPLCGPVIVELMPRSWRADFWTDMGLRALAIGSVCWSVFLLFAQKP